MKQVKLIIALLIIAMLILIGWGGFWTWVYRAPLGSIRGYCLLLPGVFDLKEAAYRVGLKAIPRSEENQYLERIKKNPGDEEANFILGYISYRRGDLPAAITYYQRALESGFSDPKIHYWLARAYIDAGSPAAAGEELEKLKIARHPLEVTLARQLGRKQE